MVALADVPTSAYTKFFYVGDSSSGKTGSLVSLVKAGYKLRILDMDNGVSILKSYVKKECPELIGNVDVESFRDKYVVKQTQAGYGIGIQGNPKAFTSAVKLLDKWTDDTVPAEWGADTFFVLDTLTTLGKAALAWAEGLSPTAKDPRQWYFGAQQAIENVVAMLMGPDFKTNVIILTHITARELQDGTQKGFPASGAGSALGPTLAKYCNTMVLSETSGFGNALKRKIKTTPTGFIDLKSAAPFATANEYDLGTGVAEIVALLKANA
jgi:hypothetical protein